MVQELEELALIYDDHDSTARTSIKELPWAGETSGRHKPQWKGSYVDFEAYKRAVQAGEETLFCTVSIWDQDLRQKTSTLMGDVYKGDFMKMVASHASKYTVPLAAVSLDFKHVVVAASYNGLKSYFPDDTLLEYDTAMFHLDGHVCKSMAKMKKCARDEEQGNYQKSDYELDEDGNHIRARRKQRDARQRAENKRSAAGVLSADILDGPNGKRAHLSPNPYPLTNAFMFGGGKNQVSAAHHTNITDANHSGVAEKSPPVPENSVSGTSDCGMRAEPAVNAGLKEVNGNHDVPTDLNLQRMSDADPHAPLSVASYRSGPPPPMGAVVRQPLLQTSSAVFGPGTVAETAMYSDQQFGFHNHDHQRYGHTQDALHHHYPQHSQQVLPLNAGQSQMGYNSGYMGAPTSQQQGLQCDNRPSPPPASYPRYPGYIGGPPHASGDSQPVTQIDPPSTSFLDISGSYSRTHSIRPEEREMGTRNAEGDVYVGQSGGTNADEDLIRQFRFLVRARKLTAEQVDPFFVQAQNDRSCHRMLAYLIVTTKESELSSNAVETDVIRPAWFKKCMTKMDLINLNGLLEIDAGSDASAALQRFVELEKYIKDLILTTYRTKKDKKPQGIAWDAVIDLQYLPVYMVAEYSSAVVKEMDLSDNVHQQAVATCTFNGQMHIVVLELNTAANNVLNLLEKAVFKACKEERVNHKFENQESVRSALLAYLRQERRRILVNDLGLPNRDCPDLIPADWHEDVEATRVKRLEYYDTKKKREKKKEKSWAEILRITREQRITRG